MSHVLPAQAPRRIRGNFWSRTWAVLVKEFIQLKRDRVSFAMIIMVPLIQLLLFGYAINTNPRHLPTAVLLQENSDLGRSILAALKNTAYFHVIEGRAAKLNSMRCWRPAKSCLASRSHAISNGRCGAATSR